LTPTISTFICLNKNGIQIPYGGCFYSNEHAVKHYLKTQEPGNMWAKVPDPGELKEGWHKQNEEMIINENMETTTLDHAQLRVVWT